MRTIDLEKAKPYITALANAFEPTHRSADTPRSLHWDTVQIKRDQPDWVNQLIEYVYLKNMEGERSVIVTTMIFKWAQSWSMIYDETQNKWNDLLESLGNESSSPYLEDATSRFILRGDDLWNWAKENTHYVNRTLQDKNICNEGIVDVLQQALQMQNEEVRDLILIKLKQMIDA